MSVHILLNLLNELGKNDQMGGLLSIWSLFRNEFNSLQRIFFTSYTLSIINEPRHKISNNLTF